MFRFLKSPVGPVPLFVVLCGLPSCEARADKVASQVSVVPCPVGKTTGATSSSVAFGQHGELFVASTVSAFRREGAGYYIKDGGLVCLTRLDADGKAVWHRTWSVQNFASKPGVSVSTDGTAYVIGAFSGTLDTGTVTLHTAFSPGDFATFVARVDGKGRLLWAKTLRGGPDAGPVARSDGVYVVTSRFDRGTVSLRRRMEIVKLSPKGKRLWTRQYSDLWRQGYSAKRSRRWINAMAWDGSGLVLAGMQTGCVSYGKKPVCTNHEFGGVVVRMTPDGRLRRAAPVKRLFEVHSVSVGRSRRVALPGYSQHPGTWDGTPPPPDPVPFVLVVLGQDGRVSRRVFFPRGVGVSSVAAGRNGGWVVGGVIGAPRGLNVRLGSLSLSLKKGDSKVFLAELAPNGSYVWAETGGGSGRFSRCYAPGKCFQVSANLWDVASDRHGNVVAVGGFSGEGRFGGAPAKSRGLHDLFVWRVRRVEPPKK
jgi:hypothetical protein